MQDNEIMYVKEIYRDEEKTLTQGIMYPYGNDMERDFLRSKLNPHMTVLMRTEYLNKEFKIIKEEK